MLEEDYSNCERRRFISKVSNAIAAKLSFSTIPEKDQYVQIECQTIPFISCTHTLKNKTKI